jgi:hypothetical protein
MTAQIAEKLRYRGEEMPMCTEPLEAYFESGVPRPRFRATSTALWRGYVGTWEVVDNRLYLVGLRGELEDGTPVSLGTLFPDASRVLAHWYSGTLRMPFGRELEYVHAGYASRFERDLFLKLDRGLVQSRWIQRNGLAKAGSPVGYGVAAMTVFAQG